MSWGRNCAVIVGVSSVLQNSQGDCGQVTCFMALIFGVTSFEIKGPEHS